MAANRKSCSPPYCCEAEIRPSACSFLLALFRCQSPVPPVLSFPASRAHRYPFVHPLVGGSAPNPLFSSVLRPAAAHLSAERRCARHSAFGSVCDGEDDILFEIAEFFSEYIETAWVFRIRLISNAYGDGRVGGKVKLMDRQIRNGRSVQKAARFRQFENEKFSILCAAAAPPFRI